MFTYIQRFFLLGPGLHQVLRDGGAEDLGGHGLDLVPQVRDGREPWEAQRRALEVHRHHPAAHGLQVRRVQAVPVVHALHDLPAAVPDCLVIRNREVLHELHEPALMGLALDKKKLFSV